MSLSSPKTITHDLEEYILGCLLQEEESVIKLSTILTPECFSVDKNRLIYDAILGLHNDGAPVDIMTVTARLNLPEMPYYITSLSARVAGAGNVEYYARILFEKFILRMVSNQAHDLYVASQDVTADPLELLSKAGGLVEGIYAQIAASRNITFAAQVDALAQSILNESASTLGLATGYTPADRITGGRHPGDLHIVGARPAMGKTTYMIQEALNMAREGRKVGLFSVEMSASQLILKMLSNEMEISTRDVTGTAYRDRLQGGVDKIRSLGIHLEDTSGLSLQGLCSKARAWKRAGLDIVYVDYLQLIHNRVKGQNREQEIGSISRGLKGLARELKIPVVVLAQLARSVEQGKDKRPSLSSLRESGSIEQDADTVEFLYRPAYYGETVDENNNPTDDVMEVIIAKNRHGATGMAPLTYRFAENSIFAYKHFS